MAVPGAFSALRHKVSAVSYLTSCSAFLLGIEKIETQNTFALQGLTQSTKPLKPVLAVRVCKAETNSPWLVRREYLPAPVSVITWEPFSC